MDIPAVFCVAWIRDRVLTTTKLISKLTLTSIIGLAGVSCQGSLEKAATLEPLTDRELVELQINFAQYSLPPPRRSIDEVKKFIREFKFFDESRCGDSEFYEVSLPNARMQYSDEYMNKRVAAFMYRDAASNSFRHGDFEGALNYLDSAYYILPPGKHHGTKGNINVLHSVLLSIMGNGPGGEEYFETGRNNIRRERAWSAKQDRMQADSWLREGAAFNSYTRGRFREAELRLRALRSSRSHGNSPMGFANSPTNRTYAEIVPKLLAITDEVFVNYILGLSLINQNRLASAEAELRVSLWSVEDAIDLAWITDALSTVYFLQRRYTEAEWIVRRMVDFFEQNCAPSHYFIVFRANLRLAQSLAAQGKWIEALPYYNAAYVQYGDEISEVVDPFVLETLDWPIAMMLSGEHVRAKAVFDQVYKHSRGEFGWDSYLALEAKAFNRLNDAFANRSPSALRELSRALDELLDISPQLFEDDSNINAREHRQSLLIDRYLSIFDMAGDSNEADKYFVLGQLGRQGKVQSALLSSALRAQVPDQDLRGILRKYQDIINRQEEIDRIYAALAAFQSADYQGPGMVDLDKEIQVLEAAKKTALDRIKNQFPRFVEQLENKPLDSDDVSSLLAPDESLILLRVTTEHTYVWSLNGAGRPSVIRASISESELNQMVARIRNSVEPDGISSLSDVPRFDLRASFSLYQRLLEPVRDIWGSSKNLIIVPDGALQQIPFSILVTAPPDAVKRRSLYFDEYREVDWLARSHSITTLPSISSLAALRKFNQKTVGDNPAFVGFGDPVFSKRKTSKTAPGEASSKLASRSTQGSSKSQIVLRNRSNLRGKTSARLEDLPPLPDTREELLSIASSLDVNPEEFVFLGERAQESLLFGLDLSKVDVIAFATHGLLPGDLDGLNEPALALSHPSILNDTKNDGLLRLSEIFGLKLNADLVILSACNTASSDGLGAEAVSGLGRAFFYAGSKSLLVSHWPVHSPATAKLMTAMFGNLKDNPALGRSEALRKARLDLIDRDTLEYNGQPVFSYAHPIFWAPFTLVGDGG